MDYSNGGIKYKNTLKLYCWMENNFAFAYLAEVLSICNYFKSKRI